MTLPESYGSFRRVLAVIARALAIAEAPVHHPALARITYYGGSRDRA